MRNKKNKISPHHQQQQQSQPQEQQLQSSVKRISTDISELPTIKSM